MVKRVFMSVNHRSEYHISLLGADLLSRCLLHLFVDYKCSSYNETA